jgi:hypothetical protein
MTITPDHVEVLVGFGLFFLSEYCGINDKLKSNSVLQLLFAVALRAFPYELRRKQPPEPPKPSVLDLFRR